MNAKLLALCVSAALAGGCHYGFRSNESADKSAKQIREIYANWAKAFEARDLNGVMAMYAPGSELTAYDVIPPLQFRGAAAYRKDYGEFFSQFKGTMHVDLSDMHIEAGRNLAFAYGIERLTGTMTNGTPVDMWVRWTDGWKRIGGQWRVIHEHVSVPVDMATGKARMDLKP